MRRTKSALLPSKTVRLKWLGAGSGTFIALVIVAAYFLWSPGETPASVLGQIGYLEIEPPSTLSGPGTINTVEHLSNGKVTLFPTCNTKPEFLAGQVIKAPTTDREMTKSFKKSLDASGKIKETLTALAGAGQVKSVHLKLENASILLATDETLLSARHDLLKGTCEAAIAENITNGGVVCQTRAVLEADVTYEIGYSETLSIGERTETQLASRGKFETGCQPHLGRPDFGPSPVRRRQAVAKRNYS